MTEYSLQSSQAQMPDLRWLVRYARHCNFNTDTDSSIEQSLRSAFGAPAWRVLCRSSKSAFVPILHNRELSIHSLIIYCRRLAECGFVKAPQSILLSFFINQRRTFFNLPCSVPELEDYELIRVANRERYLSLHDIAIVANWAHQTSTQIRSSHRWSALVLRALKYFEGFQIRLLSNGRERWHFFCDSVQWRGLNVEPITEPIGLWLQGQNQGNCLYKLRHECTTLRPSRFFAVKQGLKSVATLELAWRPPQTGDRGMDHVWGQWYLQDLRLAFNRVPGEALLITMQDFASQYNIWVQRPGRLTQERVAEIRHRVSRAKLKENF